MNRNFKYCHCQTKILAASIEFLAQSVSHQQHESLCSLFPAPFLNYIFHLGRSHHALLLGWTLTAPAFTAGEHLTPLSLGRKSFFSYTSLWPSAVNRKRPHTTNSWWVIVNSLDVGPVGWTNVQVCFNFAHHLPNMRNCRFKLKVRWINKGWGLPCHLY